MKFSIPRKNLRMTSQQIEQEIQSKGLTAPRVTPQDVEDNIACEYGFTAESATKECPQHPSLALLTFYVLVLKNGFTVTGESACASQENFDAELGRKIARQNAVDKIWQLMGYALKDRLHQNSAPAPIGPATGMSFGSALNAIKSGLRVAREGWNGKGMWLTLIDPGNAMHTSIAGRYDMQPCIGMKTARGVMQPGWLASQNDMLACDWIIVE
jgi:hypothetical protein